MGTWIGGAIFQTTFTRADAPLLVDWVDSGWGGPFALYCCMSLSPLLLLSSSFLLSTIVVHHHNAEWTNERKLWSRFDETDVQYGESEIQCSRLTVIG
jgi:hypothetical protein